MKVLVTGASGFVGSTLCDELLKQGVTVKALVRKNPLQGNSGGIESVKGDLRNADSLADAVRGVDVIYHVAGVVAALNKEQFYAANVTGTENLVRAVEKYAPGLKRFVCVSSLAAGGPSLPSAAACEDHECKPVSDYGASKHAGEQAALAMKDKFPVVVVRPPAVYGPRDKGVFTFFQIINRGFLPLIGAGDEKRFSFVHVDDLVLGIIAAGTKEGLKSGEIFYISGDGEYSWREAMELIAKGMDKKVWPLRIPISVLRAAGMFCSMISRASGNALPFSSDKVKEIEASSWTCSNAKAKKTLGFTPYWDLPRGLAATARWYRENGWL